MGFDHRGAQAGHRAGAADRPATGTACGLVQRVEAGDECAAVGEVDVVRAAGQRRTRDCIVAALERTGRVHHKLRLQRLQLALQIAIDIECGGGERGAGSLAPESGDGRLGLHRIAPGDDDMQIAIARQRRRDAAAEFAVAAEDQDPERHRGAVCGRMPATACRGTQLRERRARQSGEGVLRIGRLSWSM
jgi:hypothetical protein